MQVIVVEGVTVGGVVVGGVMMGVMSGKRVEGRVVFE